MSGLTQLKRFASYSSFGAISAFIGFITVPYLTRVLEPSDYGVIGVFLAVMQFIVPSLSFSSEGLVGIKKVQLDRDKYQNFINQYISLLFLVSLFLLLPGSVLTRIYSEYTFLLLAVPFIAFFQSLARMHYIELVQDGKSLWYGTYTITTALFLLGFTYVGVSLIGLGWEGRVISVLAVEMLMFLCRLQFTFGSVRAFRFNLSKDFFVEIGIYGLPLMFLLVAAWVLNEADRFIVLGYLSLSEVGIYTAAYSLGLAINVLNSAMTNTVVPVIYGLMKEGKGKKRLQRLSRQYSLFILLVSLVASIGFYYFGALILGDEFSAGVPVTCIILVAFGFNGMYRTVGLPLDYLKKNRLKAINFSLAAMVNITVSITLLGYVGIMGPAIGTLVSFMLLYFLTRHFNHKYIANLAD